MKKQQTDARRCPPRRRRSSGKTVLSVVALLQHPDPAIRDGLAYPALRDGVLAGALDDHAQWLIEHLTGVEGMRYDPAEGQSVPAGVVRSFAVLGLVLVVHRARRRSAVGIDLESVLQATTTLLSEDQDLTSWDPRYGWAHLPAHAADLVGELFETGIDPEPARAIYRQLVTRDADHGFIDGIRRVNLALLR